LSEADEEILMSDSEYAELKKVQLTDEDKAKRIQQREELDRRRFQKTNKKFHLNHPFPRSLLKMAEKHGKKESFYALDDEEDFEEKDKQNEKEKDNKNNKTKKDDVDLSSEETKAQIHEIVKQLPNSKLPTAAEFKKSKDNEEALSKASGTSFEEMKKHHPKLLPVRSRGSGFFLLLFHPSFSASPFFSFRLSSLCTCSCFAFASSVRWSWYQESCRL
jgi:hypothetical protein